MIVVDQCGISGCKRGVLARGMCRMHYDRWRKYGDVNAVGTPGPAVNPHVAAMEAAGVTEDQRSRWASAGYLGVTADVENPARWMWTAGAVRRAILIRRLINAGVDTGVAAKVAEGFVGEGSEMALIGPGLWIVVTYEDTP